MDEEEQFTQAFGEHTGISEDCRDTINLIRNDDIDLNILHDNKFELDRGDADNFTDQAWALLGRYIANNTHLYMLDLDTVSLTDDEMGKLFRELTSSRSLDRLDLDRNEFGISGVRAMIPLLRNSLNLSILYLGNNANFNSECFRVLLSALNGTSIEQLYLYECSITDISALSSHNLPNLQALSLRDNNIGREGYIILSNLLQKEGSTLTTLYLRNTGVGDHEVEIIAASLKHNTRLKELYLENNLTNEAYVAFLKLLIDISSIESVYTSNHTLTECVLRRYDENTYEEIQQQINNACRENRSSSISEAVGRSKVIKYQLDSQKRKEICELQGIEYFSIGHLLADIDPVLLPDILALTGESHGQSELYTTLVHTAPQLLSYIDKRALIRNEMAKNTSQASDITAQIAVLTQQLSDLNAKNDQLSKRWEMIDIGDSMQSVDGQGNSMKVGGDKKRKVQH